MEATPAHAQRDRLRHRGHRALMMLGPFWFMFVFATHGNREILSLPPPLWFGDALGDNLRQLLTNRRPSGRTIGCGRLRGADASHALNLLCSWPASPSRSTTSGAATCCSACDGDHAAAELRHEHDPTASWTMTLAGWMNQPRALLPGAVSAWASSSCASTSRLGDPRGARRRRASTAAAGSPSTGASCCADRPRRWARSA